MEVRPKSNIPGTFVIPVVGDDSHFKPHLSHLFCILQRMKHTIKKGGILYLAVPCGKDRIDWNAHRVYGKLRLPILLSGWELLGHYGYSNELTEITPFHELEERRAYGYRHALFILKNT